MINVYSYIDHNYFNDDYDYDRPIDYINDQLIMTDIRMQFVMTNRHPEETIG